ncbi:F420-dependent oxidoreductase [Beutenbergia cavernae DSM 12333]|uniref:F420-dependent oxidoreductase n=2 Tax=Beutenbergia TaxID=84756 RepID=C5BXE8_BEUC1|nr:F420-dependent oxidoreductase [Beutenbergia cavernae DSM 12333]
MLLVTAPDGVPTVTSGVDLGALLTPVLAAIAWPDGSTGVADGDVVVVASKIVSKAEGRLVPATSRQEAIDSETVRVVATRERTDGPDLRIVENRQGIVMAAAGVDVSNTLAGTALLLPEDPDASARSLRRGLAARLGARPAVLVTDSTGRPWREGIADIGIGAAGLVVLDDRRGRPDDAGRPLEATIVAAADEIAAAADLVKHAHGGRPVAVVRGLAHLVTADDGPGARGLNRTGADDLFAQGAREAYDEGYAAGYEEASHEGRDRPGGYEFP